MKRVVVDAGVAVKWYLPEEHTEAAELLLSEDYELCAPDLLVAEVGNILWKRVMKADLTAEKARRIMHALEAVPLTLWRSMVLTDAALTVACGAKRSYHDSLYVALAMTADCELVTADRKLYRALKDAPQVRKHLIWIEDLERMDLSAADKEHK